MKTSENLKEIYPKINSLLGEIDNEIKESIKKTKKEYSNLIIEEKIKFLKLVCEGESLNFNDLKNKYLSDKEKKLIKDNSEQIEVSNESLHDTIKINGKTYFYENKEKGLIYDSKTNKPVGVIKNGEPMLD